ncbi:MAG TPA: response regulator [Burkholderiales bacterium]|nr:response regulator [Burkholderiales bacterium]
MIRRDAPARPPLRVLLVEDSRMLQDRLRETLDGLPGVELTEAVDSEAEAVEAIRKGTCDAVILDLHLRRGTGFGVLREVARRCDRAPVVVVFTNYDLPEYRRTAQSLGVRHFLDKAREYERLPALIEQLRDGTD